VPAGWSPPARCWPRKPNLNPSRSSSPPPPTTPSSRNCRSTFNSGPEVTKACLACHTEAAGQIHRTKHWKWEYLNPDTKQTLGKKTVVNNFCISVASNEAACNSCHVGYGWKDASFDFKSEENVDCLACHDTTGNYKKPSGLAGNVVTKDMEFPPGSGKILKAIDLSKIAQKVGKSSRDTCGACHFFGGGGDGVKHGDLDSSMSAPDQGTRRAYGRHRTRLHLRHLPQDIRATMSPAAATRRPPRTARAPTCAARPTTAIRPPASPATTTRRTRRKRG
jgi:hypothetical protein